MPIYQFKCPECGCKKEELMKHNDPNPECILCTARVRGTPEDWYTKKVVMDKLFPTGTTFELKGEGWFKDGYSKKGGEKSSEKGDSKSES